MEIVYGMYRAFVHVIKLLRWPAGTVALMHPRLSTTCHNISLPGQIEGPF